MTTTAAAGLGWLERANHDGLARRFDFRVQLVANMVSAYIDELIGLQQRQASAFLSDPAVRQDVFDRVVRGFGFPAAVLLDDRGRVLRVFPAGGLPVGTDLTGRYPHLAQAVRLGEPAVSSVTPSVAGISVINFAAPFDTPAGRRVFAGSVEAARSPLTGYLTGTLPPQEVRLRLIDQSDTTIAANQADVGEMYAAVREHREGRFREDGQWWHYSTGPVTHTQWRLAGAISEQSVFSPVAAAETASRLAVFTAAVAGLIVVVAVGRTRRGRRQLQEANRQMGDFVAMLGHDVRQPLASIVLHAEALLEEWPEIDEKTQREYVYRITAAGHRADALVTEILTLAQLDCGALKAYPELVDVGVAVQKAVGADLDPAPDVTVTGPTTAVADPAFLQLILGNLIGNAAKYGRPPIEIAVTAGDRLVSIEISDHGEGVPEDFVAHLFDRFARADSGVATTKSGTGLGLYLVHQLATASGLTVAYRPHQPCGATFLLGLPAAAQVSAASTVRPPTLDRS
ncbi:sensor histidine kinase [Paractinoplanes toevensis]|uniref:histidine kinase n=1 Tax=Paractinoplanes toevensis TaxID=571911 RepID=A0A919T9G9_9ACTN|nr:HAMP domain-containing sensor histidine kinase [Actinoplanes toevensis]GIM90011.1 hypothetical protein Ato02nite_018040 [Actinoplanes toevensis]